MERLDKRGRRIGKNWWREYIVDSWFGAHRLWWLTREEQAIGYATEQAEFDESYPRPTLKHFMITLADPRRHERE